jgi:hypothetical protein
MDWIRSSCLIDTGWLETGACATDWLVVTAMHGKAKP